jgi:hypothetical protein
VQLAVMLIYGVQGDEGIAGHMSSHKEESSEQRGPMMRITPSSCGS